MVRLLPTLFLIGLAVAKPPHIIYLVIDDWGWANFAPHRVGDATGNAEFATPNLAALAGNGTLLDRLYGHKFCGPSRAAIQSGRLPIHVNVLDAPLDSHNPQDAQGGFFGIPRNMTGIAAKLKSAQYSTHMVGKWHAGHATPDHTPHGRGYDTSLNYMDAANDYWAQTLQSSCLDANGNPTLSDLWNTTHGASDKNNSWTCSQVSESGPRCVWEDDMLAARLLSVIAAHNASQPLFLFWSAHTVHEPYEVPAADLQKFAFVDVAVRRYYAAMLSHLDGLVGTVVAALKAKGMWDDLLWVTSSDNGGPLAKGQPGSGLVGTSGSNNYPLRGGKIGNMEGGIRLNGFVSGGLLPASRRGATVSGWMHLADFYATFCALAGVDAHDARAAAAGLPPVDSLDLSAVLLGTNESSPRTEVPIGGSDGSDHAGNTLVAGLIDAQGWKLILGNVDPAFFQGPVYPNTSTAASPEPHLKCGDPNDGSGKGCLFNVLTDPYELDDVAAEQPARVKALRARIAELQAGVYNPNRGKGDKTMCTAGLEKHAGFLGPWLP